MSVATITPAAPAAAKPAKVTPTKPIEVDLVALKARWDAAHAGETKARDLFEKADIAWQNARVIKVRVAYTAAMVKPEKGGTNLLNAARLLLTDAADTAAKRTAQAKSRKNTLRNYVDAGAALFEAGLVNNITEPDEEERKIVDAAFKAGNKRDKDAAKGAKVKDEGEDTGVEGSTPTTDEDALTAAALVEHIARLQSTLNTLRKASIVVSEEDALMIGDMLDGFRAELSAYSEGK